MQLTKFSDYALRVLMYAQAADDRLVTIDEMAKSYQISRAHLMKVVNALTRAGYLVAVRGRAGGLRLAKPPEEIVLGDVIRLTEPDMDLVECFSSGNKCVISDCCQMPAVLQRAINAFMSELDQHTLASVALKPKDFRYFLELNTSTGAEPRRGSRALSG